MNLERVMRLDLCGKLEGIHWYNSSLCIDSAPFQDNYKQWSLVFIIITWVSYNILTQKRNIVIFIVSPFTKKYSAYSKISGIMMTEAKWVFRIPFNKKRLIDGNNLIWFKWVLIKIPLERTVEGYLCHTAGDPGSLSPLVVALKISVVSYFPCKSVQVASLGSYLLFQ